MPGFELRLQPVVLPMSSTHINWFNLCETINIFRSVHSAQTISLNSLCSYCGLEKNPWKDMFKDTLWKLIVYKNILNRKEPLPEEVSKDAPVL